MPLEKNRLADLGMTPFRPFMDSFIAVSKAAGLHSEYGSGPFRPLFFFLSRLLSIPANFVFVFDGPMRPLTKRGKTVQAHKPLWWVDTAKKIIEEFGYTTHDVRKKEVNSFSQQAHHKIGARGG